MRPELQTELARLYSLPCKCILCQNCGGAGEIWTDYDYGFCTDLEPCEYCNAGISEECEQCREILEDKCSEISLQIK